MKIYTVVEIDPERFTLLPLSSELVKDIYSVYDTEDERWYVRIILTPDV